MDIGVPDAGLGISGWRAISECGPLLLLLVTQSVIYSLRLTWRLQLCCESGVHSLSDCHLCVDLVGLLRQLPAYSVQFCNSQRPYTRVSDVAAAARGCSL